MSTLLDDLAALDAADSSAMDMLVFVQKHRAEIRRNAEDASRSLSVADGGVLQLNAEMLEALQGLDAAYCAVSPDMTRDERHAGRLALIAARAAIAKALGEEG